MPDTARLETLEPRRLLASIKVLCLGDSITSGSADNQSDLPGVVGPRYEVTQTAGGYRRFLKYYLAEAGHEIDFVGNVRNTVAPDVGNRSDPLSDVGGQNVIAASSLANDPEAAGFPGYPIINDANPGVGQIAGPLTAAAMATRPDVVLVHAGTNDIHAGVDVAKQVRDFDALLSQIFAIAPNVKVIVAPLIPKLGLAEVARFNRGIHELARGHAAAGRDVVWAGRMAWALSQTSSGGPDFLKDRIHPNLQGYSKMARVWFDALTATPEQRVAPRSYDFENADHYADNFFTGYGVHVRPSMADGGILRFADPTASALRYGAVLFDPADVNVPASADAVVTADFRTSTVNSTFGIYLRVGADDRGGYLGRVVIDSSGATDLLAIYKNTNVATPGVLPAQEAAAATTRLTPNTWYTLRFSATDTADRKSVALSLAVYPQGRTESAPLFSTSWIDTQPLYQAPGQVGLRFGYGPAGSRVDADNLRIMPEPVIRAAPALPPVLPAPAAAVGLRVTGTTPNSLAFVWNDPADNETSYRLERSADGGRTWIDTYLPPDATRFNVVGLSPAVIYHFRVRAVNAAGIVAESNVVSAMTRPSVPRGLSVSARGDGVVFLQWADSAGESGYRIEWCKAGGNAWETLAETGSDVTGYALSGTAAGDQYRIRAFNAAGTTAFSNVAIIGRS